uniref:Uncharacterized protein n=1 Tax=Hyaloperonospora arabidopsidis (strain Emoy2) TaxID=559515 RepID=M4B7I0_HYAAE
MIVNLLSLVMQQVRRCGRVRRPPEPCSCLAQKPTIQETQFYIRLQPLLRTI